MSRSVSAHTALETCLLTVSSGVSLSGSGRWKTASCHLLNKVGMWVNQPQSLNHYVPPDALTPALRTLGVAWCCLRLRVMESLRKCLFDGAGRWKAAFQVCQWSLGWQSATYNPSSVFRCRRQHSRCSPRKRCSPRPPVADGAGE